MKWLYLTLNIKKKRAAVTILFIDVDAWQEEEWVENFAVLSETRGVIVVVSLLDVFNAACRHNIAIVQ